MPDALLTAEALHVLRVASIGALPGAIAHGLKQPLTVADSAKAGRGKVRHAMDPLNTNGFAGAKSPDLMGMRILVVEDSWQIGIALKNLLEAWGAEVIGPAATSADANHLASEQAPDAALIDFSLRGGERADGLIDRLHGQGVYVIVTSGYAVLPAMPRHAATFLQKPFSEAQLLDSLCRVVARKA